MPLLYETISFYRDMQRSDRAFATRNRDKGMLLVRQRRATLEGDSTGNIYSSS